MVYVAMLPGKRFKKTVKILILFSIIVFNMMKLLVILQVKAGKVMIKETHGATCYIQQVKLHIVS